MSEETKGKKKVGKLIAGVVVIGAVLVAATNFKALANSAVKLFSSPAKYYQHVEMSAMEDAVSMLSELYGEQWKEMYRLSEDKGASYTYTIEIGKDIQELLEEYVDVDGEDFSEISVSMSSSTTEAAKKNSVSASLAVKDEKVLTGNLLLDAKDWLLYLQVPEVSKDYLLFDLEDLDVPTDMTDELMESFAAIYEKLPEEKEVQKILTKYLELAVSCIEDVEEEKGTLEVGDVSQKCTELTVTIDGETMKNMAEAVLEEILDDKELEKIVTEVMSVQEEVDGDDLYEEFLEEVEELLDDVDDLEDIDAEIVMTVWVDSKGNVVGREVEVEDSFEMFCAMPQKGNKFAAEITAKVDDEKLSVEGEGKISGKKLNGEFTVRAFGEKWAEFTVEDFNMKDWKKGYVNGSVRVRAAGETEDMLEDALEELEEEFDLSIKNPELVVAMSSDKKESKVKVSVENKGELVAAVSFEMKQEKPEKIKFPSDSETTEIEDEDDLLTWLFDLDLDDFWKKLEKVGIPEEVLEYAEELFDDLAAEYTSGSRDDWYDEDTGYDDEDDYWYDDEDDYWYDDEDDYWYDDEDDYWYDDEDDYWYNDEDWPVAVEPTPTPLPMRDLGGMEIVIGDHWSPEEVYPTNAQEEATLAYRNEIMSMYNFDMKQVAVAGWGEMRDTCTNSILAGDPAAQVFVLDSSFVSRPLANGLFYDLACLEEFDFTESKWNQGVIELMTKGDSIYGMATGISEARLGLFWNKRLFEEAGIDPDLPYDLQASGEWTWSKFEELCALLTRDVDEDGLIDVYAMGNFGPDICKAFINSTGSELITVDAYGNYVNNSGSQSVLDALNFAKQLADAGYEKPTPEEANWDWYKQAFADGELAMQFNETYMAYSWWGDMEDDFGFVCVPKPDGADSYHTIFNENVAIIPACYDHETASNIAFAYNLWTNPTPGYEDYAEEAMMDSYYYRFRDYRAVEETMEIFYSDGVGNFEHLPLVEGISYGDIFYEWPFTSQTPSEKIEEIKDAWDAAVDEANW